MGIVKIRVNTRKTGIDILSDVPWGTHFCQFYQTKEDLIDILVPYFKAGLENNEFCMWVTSEPLSEKEAKEAMREALPDFDRYLKRGQIEIVPHEEWYLKEGTFNLQRVLNSWIDKLDQALEQGYDGLRTTGNTAWLEKRDWRSFTEYKEKINSVIGKYKMMAICSYSLDKCGASEVIDVVSNHQFALIRKKGKWELIESSDLKQAEEALRASEGKYRSLFDNMLEGFAYCKIIADKNNKPIDFEYIEVNDAFEKLTGLKKEYVTGKRATKAIPGIKKTHPELFKIYGKVALTGKSTNFDIYFEPLKIWLSISVYSPKKGYFVAIFDNITERKRAEEALKESQKRLKSFMESAPDAFVLYDSELNLVEANRIALGMMRMSKKELLGKNILEIAPELKESGRYDRYLEVMKTGKPFIMDDYIPHPRYGDLNVSLRAFKAGDGLGFIFTNITERMRAEEEIKSSREQLRNLAAHLQSVREEERKLIAREIHDELGQSLTALKMDLYWIDKRMPIEQRPLLKKTKSMSRLIDKTIRRIKKISAELRPGLLDYLGLPAAIEWEGKELQNRTGIKCEVNIDSEDIIMEQDHSTALFRIFQEVLTNAARHANATRVKVSLKEKAGKLELRVRDNGKGITEKQISDPKSFGIIGMRERAQFLGGEVKIRGVQDKGTTIITTVPLPQKGKT